MTDIRYPLLGRSIKALRYLHGYTQESLAYELGVHFSTLANWERNRHNCPDETANLIAEIFNVDVEEMYFAPNKFEKMKAERLRQNKKESTYQWRKNNSEKYEQSQKEYRKAYYAAHREALCKANARYNKLRRQKIKEGDVSSDEKA